MELALIPGNYIANEGEVYGCKGMAGTATRIQRIKNPPREYSVIKKIVTAAMAFSALAAQAATFNYSYNPAPQFSVSGSFDGIASGDLVTNLTNIRINALFLGVEVGGEGNAVLPYHYDNQVADWVSGGAVVSFSGSQNNFAFIPSATPSYFKPYGNSNQYSMASSIDGRTIYYFYSFTQQASSSWRLTEVTAVPEPESYALMLAGLGLMAGVARRRKLAKAA